MDFSFIHVSDIHLSRPFSGIDEFAYSEEINKVYKNAVEHSLNNVLNFAISNNVDFVLIAGDTFDSCQQDFASKLILKRCLKKLEKENISVYLVCGNHDPLSSYSKNTFNFDEHSIIKIIGLNTDYNTELPLKNKKGEQIGTLHALSFKEQKFSENPIKYFNKAQYGFNIGLLHCDLNAVTGTYAPCLKSELKELNYDYFALGHIHCPNEKADNIQYSGTIQGRNTKETGAHGIRYIKVSDYKIVTNDFISTDIIRFEDLHIDITQADDITEVFDITKNKITEMLKNNTEIIYLVKLYIYGATKIFSEFNEKFYTSLSDNIKNDFKERVFISQIINNSSIKIENKILEEDNGISGEIYRTVSNDEIIENSLLKTELEIRNLLEDCCFSDEEFNEFHKNVIKAAREECKNICAVIYENTEDTL